MRSSAEARSSFAEEGRSPQLSHGRSSETLLGGHQVFMTENVFKLRKKLWRNNIGEIGAFDMTHTAL